MKCPKCNAEIADTAKFCTKCGANIEEIKVAEEKKKIEEAKAAEEKKKIEEAKAAEEKKKIEEAKAAEETKKKKEVEPVEENKKEETQEKTENKPKKKKTTKKDDVKTPKKEEPKVEETPNIEKQEEKTKSKKKKKHTLLKFIIILILILIILVAGSYGLYRVDLLPDSIKDTFLPVYEKFDEWFGIEKESDEEDDDNEKNVATNNVDDKDEDKDEIKLADEDEELVYDYYNKKIVGQTYRIPKINLDYDNIEDINQEIADLVEEDLKQIENVTELPEGAISKTDYVWYENDNVLSLVFLVEGYHIDDYYVYNIDIYTGEEIENEDILDVAKIDEDEFAETCSEAVEDYYDNYLYSKDIAESAGSVYDTAKSESIKESNFKLSKTNIFLDDNGDVNIVAKVTTIAGAGYNNFIINIQNLKNNSKKVFIDNTTTTNVTNNSTNTTNTTNTTNVTKNSTNTTNSVGNKIDE